MKQITIKKLDIYRKYDGDIDTFARIGRNKEKILLSDADWELIDNYCQSLDLIKSGLASHDFKNKTINELKVLADELTFNQLTKDISQKSLNNI